MRRLRTNQKYSRLLTFLIVIVIAIILFCLGYLLYLKIKKLNEPAIPTVNSVVLEDKNVSIKFEKSNEKNIYYLIKNDEESPSIEDEWILSDKNEISFELDKNVYYVYLKNDKDEIFKVNDVEKLGSVTELNVSKNKIYLAIKGTYTPTLSYETIGFVSNEVKWESENESIAKVDSNGKITGVKKGTTKVNATIQDKTVSIEVLVTNLIVVRPKTFNHKKSYLPCNKYSKEENDLLDEILKDRINDVGYKTRASVVEVARFIGLEFPYKLRYFSENGRGNTNGVDGEGRYYHVGLYLHSSRFKNIKKKMHGPQTWGCKLYSNPSHGLRPNGFDCSGFISWVLLNGGFDVGDIGAGLAPHLDLTDYGKRTRFSAEIVKSGKVKVGDLLSSGGLQGGHIALIVGEDDTYYYVAESLWTPPNVAVVILPYAKKNIFKRYFYVMFMDSYYKNDGKLTKMWY